MLVAQDLLLPELTFVLPAKIKWKDPKNPCDMDQSELNKFLTTCTMIFNAPPIGLENKIAWNFRFKMTIIR